MLPADDAEGDIASDRLRVAGKRIAVAAAAGGLEPQALAAVDALETARPDSAAAAGDEAAPLLSAQKAATIDAATALLAHETIAQADNATAVATVEQLVSAVVTLRSTGFADLTKDALAASIAHLRGFIEGLVEPPEPGPPEEAAPVAKKAKKKKSKKKKAAAGDAKEAASS